MQRLHMIMEILYNKDIKMAHEHTTNTASFTLRRSANAEKVSRDPAVSTSFIVTEVTDIALCHIQPVVLQSCTASLNALHRGCSIKVAKHDRDQP